MCSKLWETRQSACHLDANVCRTWTPTTFVVLLMTGELQHQHSPWFHNTNITSCSTYNLHTIISTTTHPALAHPLLKRHPPLPHALVGALNGTLVPGRVLVIAPKIDGPPFLVLINRGKGPAVVRDSPAPRLFRSNITLTWGGHSSAKKGAPVQLHSLHPTLTVNAHAQLLAPGW